MASALEVLHIIHLYNYPPKGRWIVVDILTHKASRYISSTMNRPWRGSCCSIYQISWIKMKKTTFCKLKTSLSRNFVYNLQTFWGFCQVIFTSFVANSAWKQFFTYQYTLTSQSSSVFGYFFVRLLHLSIKFCLSKVSRNETPSWLRSQKSE